MKKSRYTDSQIINILKQAEGGSKIGGILHHRHQNSAMFICKIFNFNLFFSIIMHSKQRNPYIIAKLDIIFIGFG